MANGSLPPILIAFCDAINAGDTEAFLGFFPETGIVEDWGRRFSGLAAIRGWSDKELIGAKGTMTLGSVIEETPERISVRVDWTSTFFTGPGIFTFVLADGKIREMKISGA